MNYKITGSKLTIIHVESEEVLIEDPQDTLDLIMTLQYDTGLRRIAIDKKAVSENFFKLSNGLAGEILQKFVNYHMKLAIIGDFKGYTSKALQDFIYECNSGRDIFFVSSLEQAVEKLELI